MKKLVVLPFDQYQKLVGRSETEEEEQGPSVYTHEKIMATMPRKLRTRSESLLNMLSGTDISWTDKGEISIGENHITNSNICDLIKSVLCNYKTYKPIGFDVFVKALVANNVPETLIQNTQCRANMQHVKTGQTGQKTWIEF